MNKSLFIETTSYLFNNFQSDFWPDIRQTKLDIRQDTGYKKGRISGATLILIFQQHTLYYNHYLKYNLSQLYPETKYDDAADCSAQCTQLGIIIHDCFISGGKEKSLQCDLCPKKFAYQSHLDRHKVTHSNASYVDIKREFQCALCPCSYSHKPSLRSHMVKEHPSELLLASKKARICIFYRCLKPLEQ